MRLGEVVESQTPLEGRGLAERGLRFPGLQTEFSLIVYRNRYRVATRIRRDPFRERRRVKPLCLVVRLHRRNRIAGATAGSSPATSAHAPSRRRGVKGGQVLHATAQRPIEQPATIASRSTSATCPTCWTCPTCATCWTCRTCWTQSQRTQSPQRPMRPRRRRGLCREAQSSRRGCPEAAPAPRYRGLSGTGDLSRP